MNNVRAWLSSAACVTVAVALLVATLLIATPPQPSTSAGPDVAIKVMVEAGGGRGSGVHLGRGLILTARHVIADAKTIEVETDTGDKIPARVAWQSEHYDVAM